MINCFINFHVGRESNFSPVRYKCGIPNPQSLTNLVEWNEEAPIQPWTPHHLHFQISEFRSASWIVIDRATDRLAFSLNFIAPRFSLWSNCYLFSVSGSRYGRFRAWSNVRMLLLLFWYELPRLHAIILFDDFFFGWSDIDCLLFGVRWQHGTDFGNFHRSCVWNRRDGWMAAHDETPKHQTCIEGTLLRWHFLTNSNQL